MTRAELDEIRRECEKHPRERDEHWLSQQVPKLLEHAGDQYALLRNFVIEWDNYLADNRSLSVCEALCDARDEAVLGMRV